MLGGRDALDCRGEVPPLVLVIHLGSLRDDETVENRIVERRQFMYIDLVEVLAPTERRLRPQLLVKVVLAQIKLDNRRSVLNGRAHKGILVYLCDSRRKLHLHGKRHLPPLHHRRLTMAYVTERIAARCAYRQATFPRCQAQARLSAP